jgi:hypothetical protein
VEFRAVLRALVADNLYTWKDDLSEAENQDKIDVKVVNMRKKYVSPETSHNSVKSYNVKRRRENADGEAVLNGVASEAQCAQNVSLQKSCLCGFSQGTAR